jgi:hypothetical protein
LELGHIGAEGRESAMGCVLGKKKKKMHGLPLRLHRMRPSHSRHMQTAPCSGCQHRPAGRQVKKQNGKAASLHAAMTLRTDDSCVPALPAAVACAWRRRWLVRRRGGRHVVGRDGHRLRRARPGSISILVKSDPAHSTCMCHIVLTYRSCG